MALVHVAVHFLSSSAKQDTALSISTEKNAAIHCRITQMLLNTSRKKYHAMVMYLLFSLCMGVVEGGLPPLGKLVNEEF